MPRKVPQHKPPALSLSYTTERTPQRMADNRFYASLPWRRLRAAFLCANPLCAECSRQGRVEPAVHVHHVRERKTHPALALDWDNLQALCLPCHNGKRKK